MEMNLTQEVVNGSTIESGALDQNESILPKLKKSNGKKRILQSAMPLKGLQEVINVAKNLYKTLKQEVVPLETISTLIGIKQKSSNFTDMLNAAEAYGILQKEENGYSVSELGRKIVAPAIDGENKEAIRQAIFTPTLLSRIYTDFNKRPLPADDIFKNALEITYGIPEEKVDRTKEIIIENARLSNILSEEKGVEYLIINPPGNSVSTSPVKVGIREIEVAENEITTPVVQIENSDFENTCFVISPIGSDDSEERKHANMMLKHLIIPVSDELGIKIVRADNIDKSGIITQQILEYIAKAPYCITDLSFGNPNVFYELGVRHTCQLPTVQIIRKEDKIPFDVAQGRTIVIDTANVYTIMDRFESARKELKEHLSKMIKQKGKEQVDDNPIKIYLPELKVSFPR
jgi:hypothetical protein